MNGKSRFQVGTGVTSILMIFVVLCLTTFAILSYTSADADLDMTNRHVAYIEAYYDAYSRLNDEVARIDAVAYSMIGDDTSENSDSSELISAFQSKETKGIVSEYQTFGKQIKVVVATDINERQQLKIEVTINTGNTNNRCIIGKCYVHTEGEVIDEGETLPDMWGG